MKWIEKMKVRVLGTVIIQSLLFLPISAGSDTHSSSEEYNHVQLSHRKLLDSFGVSQDDIVNDQYIIVLRKGVGAFNSYSDVRSRFQGLLTSTTGGVGKVLNTFHNVFNGAVVSGIPRASLINLLNKNDVEYATPNKKVNISAIQEDVVWGLDRIDQISYPLSDSYQYNYTGKNVTVFVLDSGIKSTHAEFQTGRRSRVQCFFNAFGSTENCSDFNGHGTHVAATIGGNSFGVAKQVELRNVKILDKTGVGSYAGVIAGLDKVIQSKKKLPNSRMVINMSIGGPLDTALNSAVDAAVDNGIFVVAAAGNSFAADACNVSPSSASKVFTVGSTQQPWFSSRDTKSFFSNEGPCVDIFAPGSDVISASLDCGTCSIALSGTSMAAPHVAGAAALYLEKNPSMKPSQIADALKRDALKNNIDSLFRSDTPNLLLQIKLPK